jgi:hypothetical protein
MKNFNDIGNRTRDLPACGAVSNLILTLILDNLWLFHMYLHKTNIEMVPGFHISNIFRAVLSTYIHPPRQLYQISYICS